MLSGIVGNADCRAVMDPAWDVANAVLQGELLARITRLTCSQLIKIDFEKQSSELEPNDCSCEAVLYTARGKPEA
ncbi:hypothetical protein NDU88_007005 [Pleurodeles waltl]|uniref:Uncharacterized protein n=1 Tax=Pleurodeles waltl TaxID=8319 RepID=A0AAV7MIX5_PLEWA|nr:hypothetical protein NDU88_007005 [Pleurodeles waltl]